MRYLALVLDDQPSEVRLLSSVLQLRGFDVISATHCETATELLRTHCPHLLLVDISLGNEANGLEWLEEVRKGPFRNLPVIIMTGSGLRKDVEKAIRLGVDDYIIKPADFNALSKKLFDMEHFLSTQSPYSFRAQKKDEQKNVCALANGFITGISEVGVLVSSPVCNQRRWEELTLKTPLFKEHGVSEPVTVAMLNHERETRAELKTRHRVYCEVKGWKEEDRKAIRAWIINHRLKRAF